MKIRIEFGDGNPTLDDLAYEEGQKLALGHFGQKLIVLTTQIIAIVRQHTKTNVLRYRVTGTP